MKTAKISLAFFSPTGSTKRVLERMGKRWTEDYEAVMQEINLTKLETEQEKFLFGEQELVFFGTPSFGGRVPQVAARRFSNMKGSNTPAVLVVTYGNRAYEDTLLELRDIVRRNGFVPVAAAAVVAEHSIFHEIAKGRPNDNDRSEIWDFAGKIQKALDHIENIGSGITLSLPGNKPYREYKGVPIRPKAGKACIECGVCARECPAGAIYYENPGKTEEARCISCMRCVHVCPQHAREAGGLIFKMGYKKIKKQCEAEKKNEIFLPAED